jgi:hypothetical protein
VPKFVQLIKWVQEQVGVGSARVRGPRMELVGAELEAATAVFQKAMSERTSVTQRPFEEFALARA